MTAACNPDNDSPQQRGVSQRGAPIQEVGTSAVPSTDQSTSSSSTSTTLRQCLEAPPQFGTRGPHSVDVAEAFTYLFEDGVIEVDRQLVRQGVEAGVAFLDDRLGGVGRGLCIDTRVNLARTDQGEYFHGRRLIVLFTNDTGWGSIRGNEHPSWHLAKTAAHEYAHYWQGEFTRGLGEHIPGWLREGLADYVGFYAIIEAGLISEAEGRAYSVEEASRRGARTLESHEILDANNSMNYGLALLAIERLVSKAGVGALRTFWMALGRASWGDALQSAFGMAPAEFYADFESFRAAGFPR